MGDDHLPEAGRRARDLAGNWRSLAAFWGLPIGAMAVATLLPPTARGGVWAASLVWMGVACLVNARRCGRTHCRVTGPFFLVMAAVVVGYVEGVLPLGSNGWTSISVVSLGGFAGLWWGSERLLGRYARGRKSR